MNRPSFFKEEDYTRNPDWKDVQNLLQFVRPYWQGFTLAIGLIFLSSLWVILSARFMGRFVEEGLSAHDPSACWKLGGSILIFEFLAILCTWGGRRLLSRESSKGIYLIRKTLFRHIHQLPLSYYDRQPEGRTVTRMTHDVEGVEEFFTASLGRLLNFVLTFTVALGAMLMTNFKFGFWVALSALPALWMTLGSKGNIRRLNRMISAGNSACNARLSEYLKGVGVIRAFGLEEWSLHQYRETIKNHLNSQLQANAYYAWTRPVANYLCAAPITLLLWFGGQKVLGGTLSIGVFVAFVRYCERLTNPIVALSREIQVIQQALTSMERISNFLNAEREETVLGPEGSLRPQKLKGHIKFDGVEMGYHDNHQVLKNVSFEIDPGEKIGIVGTTGSGKSTTIALLARLYEFQRGHILIDHQDIRTYARGRLREQMGMVAQDVVVFKGTLYENLLCDDKTPRHLVERACEETGLAEVMKRNQMTFDTEIYEGGPNMSSGEKQLLALTRILVRDPSILILDEATGHVDPYYERLIHRAVDRIMEGRTCLIIAHRLETLKSCGRILVFRQGEICEMGTHQELLASRGYYYHLQNQ